jgi:hypothetical protein
MSDGQVTAPNGNAIKNDYQKYKLISPKQFIAFAGAKEICEQITNQVEYFEGMYNLQVLANQINAIINEDRFDQFRLLFALGGIEVDGRITIYVVEHGRERNLRVKKPNNEDDINYAFLNSEQIDLIDMKQLLINFFRSTGFNTPEEGLKTQKLLNKVVEQIDSTVNKQTYSLIIRK